MATVRLGRHEAKMGDLPQVCMCCGEAATEYRPKVFSRSPWWIYVPIPLGMLPLLPLFGRPNEWFILFLPSGLLPFFFLAYFLNRRMLVRAPLCDLHHFHWRWRSLLLFGGLGLPILAGLFYIAFENLGGAKTIQPIREVLLIIFAIALVLIWVTAAIALKATAIHETVIDDNSITLTGVANEFVEALRVHRESGRVT
jgi:hypothetical protein